MHRRESDDQSENFKSYQVCLSSQWKPYQGDTLISGEKMKVTSIIQVTTKVWGWWNIKINMVSHGVVEEQINLEIC